MKKITLYMLSAITILTTSWCAAITVNVTPEKNAIKVKHNYCKPGTTKTSNGYAYVCSSNGQWIKSSTPRVKTPKVKIRKPSISY